MRLSRIEIENFKTIGKRQAVNLQPITLLYGPNSAGKSTVLQALHYVREILERQNPNPNQIIAAGPTNFGGFKSYVHNHELDRAIRIKLVVEVSEDQDSNHLPLNACTSLGDTKFANLDARYFVGENADLEDYAVVQEVGFGIEVRWSDLLVGPCVSSLTIEMDRESLAAIKSLPQKGRAILTDFNFAHPLLRPIMDENDRVGHWEMEAIGVDGLAGDSEHEQMSSPPNGEIWELSRDLAKESTALEGRDFSITIATKVGALPDLDQKLQLGLRDPEIKAWELERNTPRMQRLTALLDELILGPVRIVRAMLRSTTYIGPLRDIPARGFRPRSSPDESRWAQGLAAWDLLYTDVGCDLTEAVNDWLCSGDKLRTGYRIEKMASREIPVPSRISRLFDRGVIQDDMGELQELYENLDTRFEVGLRDVERGITVTPGDAGMSVSQMVPIIVGCLADGIGLLIVEQPELHVHPSVQVELGDLLIHAINGNKEDVIGGKSLILETHSEHILLRLLRRVRETAEGELPPGTLSLTPDLLSVVYVEPADDGVYFQPLRIDEEGEFIDRWPSGFFEERADELF